MKLSIIIPTLNEEKYLPKLLNSIKNQTFKDFETIVVDSKSKDNTKKIAKKHKCKIINAEREGPGAARNVGAKNAEGDILLFLDADVILPPDFLEELLTKFESGVEVGSCSLEPIDSSVLYNLYYNATNNFVALVSRFKPYGYGPTMFCTKEIFNKAGGFDKQIKIGEDTAFLEQASKHGSFKFLKNLIVSSNTHIRRLEKEGRISLALKCTAIAFYRTLLGKEIKTNKLFKYDFNIYNK